MKNCFESNFLTKETALSLMQRLEWMALKKPQQIVMLGEGMDLLQRQYPEAIITNDILSLKAHSVDMIVANFILPWHANWQELFQTWHRILRPHGVFIFSSLGPDTLVELRQIAHHFIPVLVDMHDVGDQLVNAQFSDPVLDVEYLNVTYRDIETLRQELTAIHMLQHTSEEINLKKETSGLFSLTYEIIYGHGFKSEVQHQDELGIIKIPLSQLKRSHG